MSYIYYQSSTVVLGLDCSWYCRRSSLHHNLYGTMCATSACLNSLNLFLPTQAFFGSHARSKSSKSSREVTATEALRIQPARDSTPPHNAKEKTLHFDGVCTCGRFKWARSNTFLYAYKKLNRGLKHQPDSWIILSQQFTISTPSCGIFVSRNQLPYAGSRRDTRSGTSRERI